MGLFAQLPEGFGIEYLEVEGIAPCGMEFLNDSTGFVWTLDGKVYVMTNFSLSEDPIIDISDEVGYWGDHGMLGMALDPAFASNGRIYLAYAVDRHHLLYHGTSEYNPQSSLPWSVSMGRITRYTLNTSFPFQSIEGSRTILLGEEMGDGIPLMSASHGVGMLQFGSDGTLLLSTGDGSTWVGTFNGGPPYPNFAYDEAGLNLGILRPEENIGSFRSQYLNTLNGKILRIDPETGEGVPSNPFFDDSAPDSPRSKVWALGLRNPYRFTRIPNTGSSDPLAGDPGNFYISDVGFYSWEEINLLNGPALDFGWPIFEGMGVFSPYSDLLTEHPEYLNPLFDGGQCDHEFFTFQDLITQPNESHSSEWTNPCDAIIPIGDSVTTFYHERPIIAYSNSASADSHVSNTLVPAFDSEGDPTFMSIEDLAVDGEPFEGIASIGGDVYYGSQFPEEYFGAYFQTDYAGWMRAFWFDEVGTLEKAETFSESLGFILHTEYNPYDEAIYIATTFPERIGRIRFEGNTAPKVSFTQDTIYGPGPLTVSFDASETFDPDGDPLTFEWDLGDGTTKDDVSFQHTFVNTGDDPITYHISLTVSDTADHVVTQTSLVSLDNSPPSVNINSIQDSALYSTEANTSLSLSADVQDAEHLPSELTYRWQYFLHHNTHFHPEEPVFEVESSATLEPTPCVEYATYYYRIELEVTDPLGLKGRDARLMYPDCEGILSSSPDIGLEFVLYPNPNRGLFTLRGPLSMDEEVNVTIIDHTGRSLLEEQRIVTVSGRLGISAEGLSPGRYYLRLQSSEHSETIPFIIQSP